MFLITPDPGQKTLNAISPISAAPTEQEERRARHLAICQELIEMGMRLARCALAEAEAAHAQAKLTPTQTPPETDPNLTYNRHVSGVRQALALEQKIANNAFAAKPHTHAPKPAWSHPIPFEPDPNFEDPDYNDEETRPAYNPLDRGNLYEAVGTLALTHPNHIEILETLDDTIEKTLTAHPNDHLSANFQRLCQTFNIEPDRTQLQPHLESQLRPPTPYPKLE